ncbi:MAG: dihydroneopterin aldolase [Victivallales bacterium]|jgi:FolB domain-containing protein|nr:dihydroneopterin aldolase [Victivallales bacterium]
MDKIFINDLRVNTIIGCLPTERERRQQVKLNIELGVDLAAAGKSDELSDTLDYSELEEKIVELAANSRFRLIEALSGAVGRLVLECERVCYAKVRVDKPGAAKYARSIGVELEFTKE